MREGERVCVSFRRGQADRYGRRAGIGVRTSNFNALVEVLQQSMDAKKIPFTMQNRMLPVLVPMHPTSSRSEAGVLRIERQDDVLSGPRANPGGAS
jgi:hypothetical protein